MKLISMREYVLHQTKISFMTDAKQMDACRIYAKFLNQQLTLGMFVPCDEDGEVLEEPTEERIKVSRAFYDQEKKQYQAAKDKVLFDGLIKNELDYTLISLLIKDNVLKIVEDLLMYKDLTITESAIKQLRL